MNPRRILPVFLAAALTLPLLGKSLKSTQSAPERILFAVWSAQATKDPAAPIVDPIGVLAGSHIHSLGDYNKLPDAFFDHFEKTYYAPGRMFPFLVGGSSKGQLTIRNATGIYCVSLVATAKLPIPLSYPQMALAATSTEGFGLHEDWRRPPTSDQRAAFMQLSVAFLRRKRLQSFTPSQIKIDGLYSTKLGRKQPDSLIGSVTLTQKTAISHLLLVANQNENHYKIALASYHVGSDVEDHTDDVEETFVDQLDLDHEGLDEIITIVGYSESWDYVVYKRVQGGWKRIYEGGGGGC